MHIGLQDIENIIITAAERGFVHALASVSLEDSSESKFIIAHVIPSRDIYSISPEEKEEYLLQLLS